MSLVCCRYTMRPVRRMGGSDWLVGSEDWIDGGAEAATDPRDLLANGVSHV